ncbi:MAG: hypothetical protein A3H42_06485 [Deltaproteobacteria bacterium RIFCSPLOWO2_02_FULL_46_8]|nr:MAG: hypothetical protein A3H42_06485 [Deltaproteobacteria bacterium RIFCSPLOWO2_02_FULL_46_8]
MPKAQFLNRQVLFEKLLKHLSQSGPLKAKELCEFLNISQPSFSRLIEGNQSILRIGEGRQTLYALHRHGAWGKMEIPVVIIGERGQQTDVATLHPLYPKGVYLESHTEMFASRIYEGLPYFFEDLRPSGFLGRLIPRLHPDLGLPEDISLWTDDHCLLYLTRCGWDLIGNFIIGEKSYEISLINRIKRLGVVAETDREKHYPRIAELVLSKGIPGSSAAGEQPKFLSTLDTKKGLLPVIVKFSPPTLDTISHRVADLLTCEHLVHEVLRKYGQTSPRSCLIKSEGRLFLEMERFDRNVFEGRRGIISLCALALGFGCLSSSWSETAESLARQKKLDQITYQSIVWLETFGRLTGNTDMHPGNISFFCHGEKITGLAPTYDMLPMMYAPQQNQLVDRIFDPVAPKFFERPVWNDALAAARHFWSEVQHHSQISDEFKTLTADNESKLSLLPTLE